MSFDRNDPADLAALKSEVNTDPNGYGYSPGSTQEGVLDVINLKRGSITVSKPIIQAADVRATCTYEAYDGLLTPEQGWLTWLTTGDSELPVTQDLRDRLTGALGGSASGDSIWAAADDNDMEPAMLALIDIPGSRAEQLFGFDSSISRDDWIAARES